MKQLDILWKYQEADLALERYEQKKDNLPIRRKMLKIRDYVVKKKSLLDKITEQTNKQSSLYKSFLNDYENTQSKIDVTQKSLSEGNEANSDEILSLLNELATLKRNFQYKKKDLEKFVANLDKQLHKINESAHAIIKGRKDYEDLRPNYEKEMKEYMDQHVILKKNRDNISVNIEKNIMMKYQNLKKNRSNVMALVTKKRCEGCNVSLASLVVKNVINQTRIIECENCGRILYYKEEKSS